MTAQQTTKHDAGLTDVLGSIMSLAQASTRFTFRQMQNAIGLCVGSQSAMNNVRDSMQDLSHAMCSSKAEDGMNSSSSNGQWRGEPQPAGEAFTGRKV